MRSARLLPDHQLTKASHIFGERRSDVASSSSLTEDERRNDLRALRSPSTKYPNICSSLSKVLWLKTQPPQPSPKDMPTNMVEKRSIATEASSSSGSPAKSADDIEVLRSSPKPILARQNLPKPTFSSFEEYEDDILGRPVCSARPTQYPGTPHGIHALRFKPRLQDGELLTTNTENRSTLPDVEGKGPADLGASSAKTPTQSTTQPPLSSQPSERSASDKASPTVNIMKANIGKKPSRASAESEVDGPEPKPSIHLGSCCSSNPPFVMASLPKISHQDRDPLAKVCEPLNTNTSRPSFLDKDVGRPSGVGTHPSSSTGENHGSPSQRNIALTLGPQADSLPFHNGGLPASLSSSSDSSASAEFRRHHRNRHQKRDNGMLQLTCAKKDRQVVHPRRSLDLCAGNSAELCAPMSDATTEDSEQKRDEENEERNALARQELEEDVHEYRSDSVIRAACGLTDQGSSNEDIEKLQTPQLVNLNDAREDDILEPFPAFSEINTRQLSTALSGQDGSESPGSSSSASKYVHTPKMSGLHYATLFEDDEFMSSPLDHGLEMSTPPSIKPVRVERKSEAMDIKQSGLNLEAALQKRRCAAIPDYDSQKSPDRPSRGLRQIERADDVIITVFTKCTANHNMFRPKKLHWEHGKWICQTRDVPGKQKHEQESTPVKDDPLATLNQSEAEALSMQQEVEKVRGFVL